MTSHSAPIHSFSLPKNLSKKPRLHLGCGLNCPEGWINLDGSWNAKLAQYPFVRNFLKTIRLLPGSQGEIPWSSKILARDVRKPLPFADNSVSVIYTSHLLEHVYVEEQEKVLKECFRVLEPGGVLRAIVPDLRAIVKDYLGEPVFNPAPQLSRLNAERFNERILAYDRSGPKGNFLYRLYQALTNFHTHKWMYDRESLTHYFQKTGFTEVAELGLHESRISGVEIIELPGRVSHGEGICIEGVKPALKHLVAVN